MPSATSVLGLYRSTIGKKAAMALSGAVLFGFVVVHMVGNLQVFAGPEKIDSYAKWLHQTPALLWGTRVVLLVAVMVHVYSALQLIATSRRARPDRYRRQRAQAATLASRSMRWGGLALFAFIVYHLLHFTLGQAHHNFVPGQVYCNMVTGFSIWWVSGIYVVAQILLGLHLYHGSWSLFQTLGLNSPRYQQPLRRITAAISLAVMVGNISMPVAVLAGVISGAGLCW